ncbi:hypothetical protein Calag_0413 [Caldisphaera lagunensis DSM 15908]|uniref:Membrane protein involved in the export of O-antigen and teichoic acid n=2 Tax=Caldisphaera lagunensis TaxID=200415 RepID=L0AAP5_CALLD|nr:hypothetical protein Calag_0413 [Caldisphaera lagunensis DSM 15908]
MKQEETKSQRLEAIRITTSRTVLYFLSILINIVATIVLARKLAPTDYAIYQLATKRIIQYATIPLSLAGLWIYRYLVERQKGSYIASFAFATIQFLITLIIGSLLIFIYAKPTPLLLVIASLSIAFQSFYYVIRTAIDAVRPVRLSLLELIYRTSYSLLIFIALYIISNSLILAFVSTLISFILTSTIGMLWLKDRILKDDSKNAKKTLKEWFLGSHATAVGVAFGLMPSLDALIAYPLIGSLIVAAFFVVSSVSTLLRDSTNVGLRYLHSYVLRTGDFRTALRNLEVSLALVIPFLVYGIMHPVYVIYVYNPIYSWASFSISIFLITAIIEIINNGISQIASGNIRESGIKGASKFTKMSLLGVIPSIIYLALIAFAFFVFRGMPIQDILIIWSIIYLIRYLLSVLITSHFFIPKNVNKNFATQLLPKLIFYISISLALSYFIKPIGPPSSRLLIDIKNLAIPGIIEAIIFYGILIAADKGIRRNLTLFIINFFKTFHKS